MILVVPLFLFLGLASSTNGPIPERMRTLMMDLVKTDLQREGTCVLNNITMTVRIQGQQDMSMPTSNSGCEDWCSVVGDSKTARAIFYNTIHTSVPERRYQGQKIMAFGVEPRLMNGEAIWDPHTINQTNAIMTYNLDSNLPRLPFRMIVFYHAIKARGVPTREDFEQRRFMIFVSSRCGVTERTQIVRELMKFIPIEARGKCLNNAPLLKIPKGSARNGEDNDLTYREYKFVLSIEKVIDQDYVTEKFVLPFMGNSIPVYRGSPTASLYAPGPHSYIDMTKFPTIEKLATFLWEIGNDYDRWVKYFDYVSQPIEDWQERIQHWIARHPSGLCRVCDCLCDDKCSTTSNPGKGINWS